MGSVVALDAFRKNMEADRAKAVPPRPDISGGAVWGRDYREVEAIVYGLLQARGLVAHHTGEHDAEFDHLCMHALDAAYHVADLGQDNLKRAVAPLKRWILAIISDGNKRDLSWALVLLDLIEKSPSR